MAWFVRQETEMEWFLSSPGANISPSAFRMLLRHPERSEESHPPVRHGMLRGAQKDGAGIPPSSVHDLLCSVG